MKSPNSKLLDATAVELRREYYKRWRAANRDKVRQHNQNYWKKTALKAMNIQFDEKEG